MAMIKEFECINDTCDDIILMESVEGVNRPLARLPPKGNYMVRSIVGSTTDCEYIVTPDRVGVPGKPSRESLPDCDWDWVKWDAYVAYAAAPEGSHFRVLNKYGFFEADTVELSEHNTGNRLWNIICTMLRRCFLRSNYSQMGIRVKLDSGYIEGFHRREIKSLRQIKSNLDTDGSAALELWESKEKVFRLEIENSEAELKYHGNIIFQLVIGLYTVFHGVLFTVVAQADSPFTCGKIYISYIVSGIISFATIFGVIKNVSAMELLKKLIYMHKARLLAVCRWQSTLKRQGDGFEYGKATLRYKPMGDRRWWPLPWLPLKAAIYAIFLLVCTVTLCFLMRQLQCK